MNNRLTAICALAVVLASCSLFSVLTGAGWLIAGAFAAAVIAVAGTLTRLDSTRAAIAATVIALIATFAMLSAQSWGWKLAGLAIIALTAASVTRLKVLPVFAGAVTYLGLLLIYLDTVFAGSHAVIGLVPTGSSLHHLWQVANQGWAVRALAPPVAASLGVDMLAAAGIGLVAMATDLIAVRLRSPAIAGLPLLVLFSVPITTSAKPAGLGSSVTFCLAVIGFLAMLAADGRERMRIWGRLITVWHGVAPDDTVRSPDTRSLAAAGRRIGLAAVCVAVIAPLLIPNLRLHDLFAKHNLPGAGGTISLPEPFVQMQQQLNHPRAGALTVFTYTTSSSNPRLQYLPVYVLNYNVQDSDFKIVQVGSSTSINHGTLPTAQGLLGNTPVATVHTKITMSNSVSGNGTLATFLPVPYAPSVVTAAGSWFADKATLMIWSSTTKLSGLSYTVTSTDPQPTQAELNMPQTRLPSSITSQYLGFADIEKSELVQIAKQHTASAHTQYAKAVALATWLGQSGQFSYNQHPPWLGQGAIQDTQELIEFLTVHRSGFCQQFAYAMAILARLIGIPSRIAVGYTAGVPEANDRTWKITDADAHAWPELYFKDVGWLRFEPTPSGTGGQPTATQPAYGGGASQGLTGKTGIGGTTPLGTGKTSGSQGSGRQSLKKFLNPATQGGPGSLPGGGPPILPFVLLALVLAAIAPATGRLLVRRSRWRRAGDDAGLAHAAWQELCEDLHDYGLTRRLSESPRRVASRIADGEELDLPARQALDRLARAEERARYAVTPEPGGTLRADLLTVRHGLAQRASYAINWRARLLPPSALMPVSAALQQVLDVFGWMDAAGRRMRRRPQRPVPGLRG